LTRKEIRKLNLEKPLLLLAPWLRAGELTFIYGEAGTGKSFLAMTIAYLLGLKKHDEAHHQIGVWQVKNPTGCYYIDGEMGAEECDERFSKFEWLGEQRDDSETVFLDKSQYQFGTEKVFSLADRKNQLKVIDWLKRHPNYKLVVLDSISTLFGLEEENSNSEWSNKVNPFLGDLRALGVACVILHHSGKDSGRGLRGASSMSAMAHNIFRLKNHPDRDIDEGEAYFTLIKEKQRAGGFQFKSFSLHYSPNSDHTATEWEVVEGGKKKDYILTDKETRIVRRRLEKRDESQQEIATWADVDKSFVSQTLTKAVRHGLLEKVGKNYIVTPKWVTFIKGVINSGIDGEDDVEE
jgi:RecA-family ATPase